MDSSEDQLERGSLVAEEARQNHTVMKTKSAIDQVKEFTPRTLKEIVHGRAKTLRLRAFAITESNGERFKKSIGKVTQLGRLGSIR
jgi:hypothetical protein